MIDITRTKRCPICDGTGVSPRYNTLCGVCGGRQVITEPPWIPRYKQLITRRQWNEAFELLADGFECFTGHLAPGKDVPAAVCESDEERKERELLFTDFMRAVVQPWL